MLDKEQVIESKYFIINYYGLDIDDINIINKYLNKKIVEIIDFFGLTKLHEKISITLFNDVNKLWELHNNLYKSIERYGKVPEWVSGFSIKNNVYTVSLNEFKKTKNNSNSTIEDLEKLIVHECIHCIHSSINKETLNMIWFREGMATVLSEQNRYINNNLKFDTTLDEIINGKTTYQNYYIMFKYALDTYGKSYINKLTNDYDFLYSETEKLYNELYENYKLN